MVKVLMINLPLTIFRRMKRGVTDQILTLTTWRPYKPEAALTAVVAIATVAALMAVTAVKACLVALVVMACLVEVRAMHQILIASISISISFRNGNRIFFQIMMNDNQILTLATWWP
jgi:hypothetical protein